MNVNLQPKDSLSTQAGSHFSFKTEKDGYFDSHFLNEQKYGYLVKFLLLIFSLAGIATITPYRNVHNKSGNNLLDNKDGENG